MILRLPGMVVARAMCIAIMALAMVCGCNSVATSQPGSAAKCHDIAPMAASAEIAPARPVILGKSLAPAPHADQLMHEGSDAFAAGEFGLAAARFEQAAREYDEAGHDADRCDALYNLASAEQALGSFKEAADHLNIALRVTRDTAKGHPVPFGRDREIAILTSLGAVYTFTRNDAVAEDALTQALKLAEAQQDEPACVKVLNNLGNLKAAGGNYEPAAKNYSEAAERAAKCNYALGQARAMTNQALAISRAGSVDSAVEKARAAREFTATLSDGHDKGALLLAQGQILWNAMHADEASDAYVKAGAIAQKIGDKTLESFALGYQGEIAEAQKRNGDALSFTRRALFLAQESRSAYALFRWEWQAARLLRDAGQITNATAAYDAAIKTLQEIHGDLANGYGNEAGGKSFRESVGPVYYEMADLLLRQADMANDEVIVQSLLHRAQDTVELLKSGELDDYFHQKCVNILSKKIEQQASSGAAVVYLIPLPDRTEMLVSTADGMTRFKSPVGADELTREVREFRDRLEDRTSNRYLLNARKLYNWIIRPIEPTLAARKIDTLIFVPDGALRTIPMAALNDGKDFLINKYAIAITPGLTLMTSGGQGNEDISAGRSALEGGLSVSKVEGFAPLEFVPQELKEVHSLFPQGAELLNQSFTADNFRSEMNGQDFNFVHLASHAEFSHNEGDTFLLTYDRKLSLDDLSRLIERHRYSNGKPLELLALSACQTAAGDDRAALGLAGVAIRMGARTAVATLWSVNDQASAELVQQFYQSLSSTPNLSKARAMQRAQLSLLADARYRHPCYWAPFLVIGNWN